MLASILLLFVTKLSFANASKLETLMAYDILRSNCLDGYIPSNDSSSLVGDLRAQRSAPLQASDCLKGNGISDTTTYISDQNIMKLIREISKDSFSVELWLKPSSNLTYDATILSLKSINEDTFCPKGNLALYQVGRGLSDTAEFVVYACNELGSTNTALSSSPISLKFSNDLEVSLLHIMIQLKFSSYSTGPNNRRSTLYEITSNFTVNGVDVPQGYQYFASTGRSFDPSSWNFNDMLIIFPESQDNLSSGLALYKLAFYNKTLNKEAIQMLYNEPFPNSPPVAWNSSITILENGQVGDHSNDPAYFEKVIAISDLPIIELSITDFDESPSCPNYNIYADTKMLVRITPNELNGFLYFINGTEFRQLETSSLPWDETYGYAFRYRPPKDKYSDKPLSIINFYGIDGVTGAKSSTVNLEIYVQRVIKPPKANNDLHAVVLDKTYSNIELSGSADLGQFITSANISTFPKFGTLMRVDKTILSREYPSIKLTNSTLKLVYLYNESAKVYSSEKSVMNEDSFDFFVIDNNKLFSTNATFRINITTSIETYPMSFEGVEDENVMMQLFGRDNSDLARAISAEIVELPENGALKDPLTGKLVAQVPYTLGEKLRPNQYSNGLPVIYLPNTNIFTFPNISWNGTKLNIKSDGFRMKMTSSDGAESLSALQRVHIRNVNDATRIIYEDPVWKKGIVINAFAGGDRESINFTIATLKGFKLIDPDLNLDPIRVQINTSSLGRISLNKNALQSLDFNSKRYCVDKALYFCSGDGVDDSNMKFVASVHSLEEALNSMTYYSTTENIIDELIITIFDGEGEGNCFTQGFLGFDSIYRGCLITQIKINIEVKSFYSFQNYLTGSGENKTLDLRLQYIAVGLILTVLLLICRFCFCRNCFRRKEKEKERRPRKRNLTAI